MIPLSATASDSTDSTSDSTSDSTADSDSFLRQYAETFRFGLGKPASIEIPEGGDAVLFLRTGPRDFVRDLYRFDPATGEETRLLTAEDVLGGEEEELTAEEKARRERMRLAARGFADYSLSGDGEKLLAALSGELFVVDWRSGAVRELAVEGGFPIDPRFSPDGERVAYSAGGDLWVIDLAGADGEEPEPRRLTRRDTEKDGEHVSYGVPEFAAQEEMDRDHGYWWSPDGDFLAYQRNDDSALPVFHIADPSDPAEPPQSWRYPRAGTVNTDVRLGVVPATGGDTVWIDWDRETYPYLASVRWQKNAPLTILVQNRRQTEEILYAVDPSTGETTELLRETDEAWLNLDQDVPRWLPGGDGFLWTSERSGEWRLELRNRDGSLRRVVTPEGFHYGGLLQVAEDGESAWVLGSENALDRHVYRVALGGTTEPSEPVALTEGPGRHGAEIAADGSLAVVLSDPGDGVERWRVREITKDGFGDTLGELESVAELPDFDLDLEFLTVDGLDGEPKDLAFHAVVIRPDPFEKGRKYPVILHVYGGPHNQMVQRDGSRYFLDQWIANQGYVVVSIDGRGTLNRGREWERAIRHDFIGRPLGDQAAVLERLGERLPELDLERVGVYGWSFGGYFSAMAVMRRPDLFRAAVAGAPVTDWQDYDTHYTERYIGLPSEHPEAYERSNVTTYAKDLERPLLIIHGTADDNVYFVHGLKMSHALFAAGKPHEFLPLAGQTHMVADPLFVEQWHRRMMDFFAEHLAEEASGD